jgi:hypothetical protein
MTILYHEVPNPNLTIRNFFIAVPRRGAETAGALRGGGPGGGSRGAVQLPARQGPVRPGTAMKKLRIVILATVWHFVIEMAIE